MDPNSNRMFLLVDNELQIIFFCLFSITELYGTPPNDGCFAAPMICLILRGVLDRRKRRFNTGYRQVRLFDDFSDDRGTNRHVIDAYEARRVDMGLEGIACHAKEVHV
ncbi:Fc.00g096570.m01.CDS01 [Cosmosporella sp. VM-42]